MKTFSRCLLVAIPLAALAKILGLTDSSPFLLACGLLGGAAATWWEAGDEPPLDGPP